MAETDKAIKFISKLVQLTQSKEIEWEAVSSPDDKSSVAYVSDVSGRKIRIRSYAKEYPNPDYEKYIKSPFSAIIITGREPPETLFRSGIVLEVLNNRDIPVYNFENKAGLSDLLETASYSSAKVDDLMESVLSK